VKSKWRGNYCQIDLALNIPIDLEILHYPNLNIQQVPFKIAPAICIKKGKPDPVNN